jgi:hypothetical protein
MVAPSQALCGNEAHERKLCRSSWTTATLQLLDEEALLYQPARAFTNLLCSLLGAVGEARLLRFNKHRWIHGSPNASRSDRFPCLRLALRSHVWTAPGRQALTAAFAAVVEAAMCPAFKRGSHSRRP